MKSRAYFDADMVYGKDKVRIIVHWRVYDS